MKWDPSRALAIAAGLVIIALTAAAFWLSYAHLAEVALAHGMQEKTVRAWAWPATLDLFIVAGELLMLRAALAGKADPWAIGLTVVGSGSSIALNVAGVGTSAGTLDYVVAAVPPTAALLAFGALMRQIHQALAEHARTPQDAPEDAQDADPSPAVLSVPPVPEVVPPGVRLLPVRCRPKHTVTLERADTQDADGTPELPPGTDQDAEDAEDGPPPEPPLMTSNDVARHYGVEPSTVRNWVASGRLDVFTKDARGRNLFHPEQLNAPHVGVGT